MPRCKSLPDGPCPAARNDRSVQLSKGDQMLCESCENMRFPYLKELKDSRSSKSTKAAKTQPKANAASSSSLQSQQPVKDAKMHESAAECDVREVVVNELLAYVSFYRDRATPAAVSRVVTSFFSASEITGANKRIYVRASILNCPK